MDVLIVEDARDQQLILSKVLEKQGHKIYLAENGNQALEVLDANPELQMVLSDWMMPEMDGLALCREIRDRQSPHYIYFILLTGKSDDDAVIQGMNMGADDFLRKPVNFRELQVRLKAGFRVLALEKDLGDKNQQLREVLNTLEIDLQSAAGALLSLLPAPCRLHNVAFDWRFNPSKILGGDMLGIQALDNEHISFYQIDVSGHGIPSALFSFSLNHLLSDKNPRSSILIKEEKKGESNNICRPDRVLETLNERFQNSIENTMYFTMVYGVLNTASGELLISHAGHPGTLHISSDQVTSLKSGGLPVGMMPDQTYSCQRILLKAGDALFCYTDGLTESMNEHEEMFGEERLQSLAGGYQSECGAQLLDDIVSSVISWQGSEQFEDDVSCMLLNFKEHGWRD